MNPFATAIGADQRPPPATIVIFGASGDLTKRKLIPALYNLMLDGNLSKVAIIGSSRTELSDDQFRTHIEEGLKAHSRQDFDPDVWATLSQSLYYEAGDYDDPKAFIRLRERLEKLEAEHDLPDNRLYYLSVPPSLFTKIIGNLGRAGLMDESKGTFSRVIIEKPFGRDLASAQALNKDVHEVLSEKQIFRIDHYLGKETVQNLMAFRFANSIFEPLWNSRFVDHVQITGAETLGVEGRGGYFESAGILRDMVQNHLFQVLCLAAMEPPTSLGADAIRNEKTKVLEALRPVPQDKLRHRVIRGQYATGSVLGTEVPGYRDEDDTAPKSNTDTFVALELYIDNWRWAGVPFYLRSGKRMPKKVTEIAIHFKGAPLTLFGKRSISVTENVLAIRIQPDEGITLKLGSKVPGQAMEIAPVLMEFRYASSFGMVTPEAYERLLLDALNGDGTLFIRGDEAEASWRFITPIHEMWEEQQVSPDLYPAGDWGPSSAHELLSRSGRRWRNP